MTLFINIYIISIDLVTRSGDNILVIGDLHLFLISNDHFTGQKIEKLDDPIKISTILSNENPNPNHIKRERIRKIQDNI